MHYSHSRDPVDVTFSVKELKVMCILLILVVSSAPLAPRYFKHGSFQFILSLLPS